MIYDESENEFYCENGGASYCCPTKNCSILNDPGMSFDTELLDIDFHLDALEMTANDDTDSFETTDIFLSTMDDDDAQYQFVVMNSTAQHLEGNITCTEAVCVVQCLDLLSCAFITVTGNSTDTIIECRAMYSCLGAAISVDDTLVDHNVKILCLESNSCGQMQINATNTDSFNLFCAETSSCLGLVLNLEFVDDGINH